MTPPKRSFNILNVNLWGHGGLGVKTFASYLQGTYILIYLKIFKAYFLNVFFFFLPFSFCFPISFPLFPPSLSLSVSLWLHWPFRAHVLLRLHSDRQNAVRWGEVRRLTCECFTMQRFVPLLWTVQRFSQGECALPWSQVCVAPERKREHFM